MLPSKAICLFALCACVASSVWLLVGGVRRYALARQLLDVPNARSSHLLPTPRGGGMAFALVFVMTLPLQVVMGGVALPFVVGVGGSTLAVALLGFCDDHGHLAVRWRLLGQGVSVIWLLGWLGVPELILGGVSLGEGLLIHALLALCMLWMINLYNFMDGIDGIAAAEAITMCMGGGVLAWAVGNYAGLVLSMVLAAAVAGFLPWNFPRARIFMGDGGSGFLGLALCGLALQAAMFEPRLFWSWVILSGVFVVDATWTLFRRLQRGEVVYQAHCSHAYQLAAKHLKSHVPVTTTVALINVFWLLPIALWVGLADGNEVWGVLIAWMPLWVLAVWFKAGCKA